MYALEHASLPTFSFRPVMKLLDPFQVRFKKLLAEDPTCVRHTNPWLL